MNFQEYAPKGGWLEFFRKRQEETVGPATAIVFAILTIAFPFVMSLACFLDA